MLRISVRLDPALLERGELLAEASALEAAGVDTLWLPEDAGGLDGFVLLAGLAGSVRRVRLGLELGPRHPGWRQRVHTLQLLSRERLVLSAPGDSVPANPPPVLLSVGGGPLAGIAGQRDRRLEGRRRRRTRPRALVGGRRIAGPGGMAHTA